MSFFWIKVIAFAVSIFLFQIFLAFLDWQFGFENAVISALALILARLTVMDDGYNG